MNIQDIDEASIFYAQERRTIGIISERLYKLLQNDVNDKYFKEKNNEEENDEEENNEEENDEEEMNEMEIDISEIVELYNSTQKYLCDIINKIAEKMENIEKIDCEKGLIREIKIKTNNNVYEIVIIIIDGIERIIKKIKELESIINIDVYTFDETLEKVKDKFI